MYDFLCVYRQCCNRRGKALGTRYLGGAPGGWGRFFFQVGFSHLVRIPKGEGEGGAYATTSPRQSL